VPSAVAQPNLGSYNKSLHWGEQLILISGSKVRVLVRPPALSLKIEDQRNARGNTWGNSKHKKKGQRGWLNPLPIQPRSR
jgi:hypothetical protein